MKVQTRLTLRFGIIVASILLMFSVGVYLLATRYGSQEFYERIERRATLTTRLKLLQDEVEKDLHEMLNRKTTSLSQEQLLVFDENNQIVYHSTDTGDISYTPALLNQIKQGQRMLLSKGLLQQIGFKLKLEQHDFIILASAHDVYGVSKLKTLRNILVISNLISIFIIVLLGSVYARQALEPLHKLVHQVSEINAGNLGHRVDEGRGSDEFEQLAMQFNQMLGRLQAAFDTQRNFVASASHELRTPLAAIRSQLQVALSKDRNAEDYRKTLQSLYEDTEAFEKLTTGLLQLAQTDVESQRSHFQHCRIDEALLSAQEALLRLQPSFHVQLNFDETSTDDEAKLTVFGNDILLSTAFLNLMENACKFSEDRTVRISVSSKNDSVGIAFADNGIGIPVEEQTQIFSPFQRASNANGMAKGHGIGLSICQKIMQLHGGSIKLASQLGNGSVFTIHLPNVANQSV